MFGYARGSVPLKNVRCEVCSKVVRDFRPSRRLVFPPDRVDGVRPVIGLKFGAIFATAPVGSVGGGLNRGLVCEPLDLDAT